MPNLLKLPTVKDTNLRPCGLGRQRRWWVGGGSIGGRWVPRGVTGVRQRRQPMVGQRKFKTCVSTNWFQLLKPSYNARGLPMRNHSDANVATRGKTIVATWALPLVNSRSRHPIHINHHIASM